MWSMIRSRWSIDLSNRASRMLNELHCSRPAIGIIECVVVVRLTVTPLSSGPSSHGPTVTFYLVVSRPVRYVDLPSLQGKPCPRAYHLVQAPCPTQPQTRVGANCRPIRSRSLESPTRNWTFLFMPIAWMGVCGNCSPKVLNTRSRMRTDGD